MNIGIIDSGIIKKWISDDAEIVEEKKFVTSLEIKYEEEENLHGTLVVNTLQKYANQKNRYYICDIMSGVRKGSSKAVLEALQYLQTIETLEVIIMSLCICSKNNRKKMNGILRQLNSRGIVIFAAESNTQRGGYPAVSPYVIGVGTDRNMYHADFSFHRNAYIEIHSNAYPEFIALGKEKYQLFMGNSKATPLVVGIIMKLMGQEGWNKKNVMRYAKKYAKIEKKASIKYFIDCNWIWKDIEEFNKKKYNVDYKYEEDLETEILEILKDLDDIYEFLVFICDKRKKEIDYNEITFKDFRTIGALVNYFNVF